MRTDGGAALVVGKCDAVTYQVLGHLKTMLVLAFGFFMRNNHASWRDICGILCALVGMVAYGYCENLDKQAEAGFLPVQRQCTAFTRHCCFNRRLTTNVVRCRTTY